jgi:putative chitinase
VINAASLQAFAPHAWEGYVQAFTAGTADLEAAGINTPLRISHFLAQCAHESMGLAVTREETGWSGEQMRRLWPARFPLGPADPRILNARGDPEKLANLAYGKEGYKYRGGGLIQLTGRANYAACGDAIGYDLESYPDQIEDPTVALKAAIWFWSKGDLNRFADYGYLRAIGNAINRGNPYSSHEPIGAADRQQWFKRAWHIFGADQQPPSSDVLWLGAHGRKVEQVQTRLRDLGYPVGAVDGVFGPATARAVAGFKLDQGRAGLRFEPDEAIGPTMLTALETADPAPLSAERTAATAKDLERAGSTEVAAGRKAKAAGQVALYTGATMGADKVGLIDTIQSSLGGVGILQSTLAPIVAAIQWGLRHALWVLLIVGGVWAYMAFRDVVSARLQAHRNGANLGR